MAASRDDCAMLRVASANWLASSLAFASVVPGAKSSDTCLRLSTASRGSGIASLAVINTVFASVQARSWQFGILRGVGLSSGQLFRLVISESLMIFAAAGVLSLAAGVLLAWCGIHICTYFFYFAGRTPPLVLPWSGLSLGFGIAFGLCFIAGLIPAWRMARKEPLAFIQAGRLSV